MPRDLFGSLLTEVSRAGFGFRHLAHSRSGRPLLGALAQPAAVLRSTRSEHTGSSPVGGASRGYRTAARALVGKSYAPSAPHASQGTSQQEAAEGLRLAVVEQLLPGTERVPRCAAALRLRRRRVRLRCRAPPQRPCQFPSFLFAFVCMRAGQVVSVPARAMRRCVVCVPSGVWPGRASGASLSVVAARSGSGAGASKASGI
jgi:hypothetical protein